MENKHFKRLIIQWLLPAGTLLLIVIFLLVRYSVTSTQAEQTEVEDGLIASAKSYAMQLVQYWEGMKQSADIAALHISEMPEDGALSTDFLKEFSDIMGLYEAVVIGDDGIGFNSRGEAVDLSGSTYLNNACAEKTTILYTADDSMDGGNALIVTAPVPGEDRWLIGYSKMEAFSGIVQKVDFGADAVLLLVERKGEIVNSFGYEKSPFYQDGGNYFTFLKENAVGSSYGYVDKALIQIQNGGTGISYMSCSGERRGIIYVPVGDKFELLVSVYGSYINQTTRAETGEARSMIWQTVIVLIIFVLIVVVVNIVFRVKDHETSKTLVNKADTDLLTGLYNKVATETKIKEYMANNPEKMGLMFVLDIDNFKKINDTMGHSFGDEVLRTLGAQIRAEFRATDILGRIGGDEFMVFLCGIKEESIKSEAARLERFFKNFQAGTYVKYSATASIGAAIFPTDAKDFESLYKAADAGVYVAKKRGKNQLAFYGEE